MAESLQIVHDPLRLRVDVARQALDVLRGELIEKTYIISTSRFGLGTTPGSYCTPLGRFQVSEKHGHNAPLGAVFKSRQPTGEISPQGGEEDLVLTRILWLDGLDVHNANSKSRYIYIHGTNQEARLGTPASHGCVRMANADIAELFQEIPEGTFVEIIA
jgi:lipoprotein-anchoring transpeptidase ErfK/SrfK